jgi:nucleoid-associated protein YgaU
MARFETETHLSTPYTDGRVMTRETKVGLLVGMCVILLIGIIVSDHLAVVQREDSSVLTDLANQAQRSIDPDQIEQDLFRSPTAPPGPGVGQGSLPAADTARVTPVPMPAELAPAPATPLLPGEGPSPQALPPGQSQQDYRIAAQPDAFPPTLSQTTPMVNPTGPAVTPTAYAPVGPAYPSYPGSTAGTSAATPATASPTGLQPLGTLTPRDFAAPATPTPAAEAPTPDSAQSIVHYVKPGESLWQIAQRYYNNGDKWSLIAKANPKVVQPNGSVRQGVRLVIPNDTRAIGRASDSAIAFADEPTPTPLNASGATPAGSRTVKVQSGDTLSSLAQRHLGSSARWREIYEANRDQLHDSDDLQVGMTLRLPAGSPGARGAATSAAAPPSNPSPRSGSTTYYTVQSNDTLSSIAQKTLGSRDAWKRIFEANRDQLDSADELQVGQKLKIPAP